MTHFGPGNVPTPSKLKVNKKFQPCIVEAGDEMYPNGIFVFNITKLLAFIEAHPQEFPVQLVELEDIPCYGDHSDLNAEAVRNADLSRPLMLAEISPGLYNLIDGHHRFAKARREGSRSIPAYRIRCPQHVPFLTTLMGYEKYVEYWNSKVRALQRSAAIGAPLSDHRAETSLSHQDRRRHLSR